ncbi:MAG: hypothetical protein K2M95_01225 [Clostridiales bacterium]|nr:hypothetical protein [Clostridiales bacterium]
MENAENKLLRLVKTYLTASYEGRTLYSVRVTLAKNLVWGILKFVFACATRSLLIGLSALFTALGGISRAFCFLGLRAKADRAVSRKVNAVVAISLMLSGMFYAAYFLYVLLSAYSFHYTLLVAILIAFFSFVDVGVALRGLHKSRGQSLLLKDIKIISLMGALTALVLTSAALLSCVGAEIHNLHYVNGGFGMGVGFVIFAVGVFMLFSPRVYAALDLHRRYAYRLPHAAALDALGLAPDFADVQRQKRQARRNPFARRRKRGLPAFCVPFARVRGYGTFCFIFDFVAAEETVLCGYAVKRRGKRTLKKWQRVLLYATVLFWFFPYLAYLGVMRLMFSVRRYTHVLDAFMNEKGFEKIEREERF